MVRDFSIWLTLPEGAYRIHLNRLYHDSRTISIEVRLTDGYL